MLLWMMGRCGRSWLLQHAQNKAPNRQPSLLMQTLLYTQAKISFFTDNRPTQLQPITAPTDLEGHIHDE